MAYFKLQLKKVLKSTLTWLALGIVLLVAGLILGYNAASGGQSSIRTQAMQTLNRREQGQAGLPEGSGQAKDEQAILTALDEGNWRTAYRLTIRQNKTQAARVKIGGDGLKQEAKKKNARLQALMRANVPEEDEQRPKEGWLFLFKLMEGFLPALLIVMLCFILSNLFAAKYVDQLNRATLLPSNHTVALDLILGLLVAGGLTLLVGLIIWGTSSLLFGPGSLAYPLQGIILPSGLEAQYQPLSAWLAPTLILTALAGTFTVLLILLLAQISRSQMSCLFLALVLLLGGAILPLILQATQQQAGAAQTSIAQYLPMTYLLSAQVATGSLGVRLQAPQLNFGTGCQVLIIAIVVLVVLNFLWPRLARKSRQLL
ncbi:hypothetical protein EQ500_00840 [Lactobacillus sp. XV13L]|nr:hypothetical protein [Lactobacillus sp. XV13L]